MIDQMKDTIRKASKVVEAPRQKAEEAVRKIAENPDFDIMDAPQIALEILRKGKGQADRARAVIDDSIRRRLNEMGLATKEEVERLQARVAELEEAVALAAPPARKTGPKTPRAPRASTATGSTRRSAAEGSATGGATGPKTPSRPPRAPRARRPDAGPTHEEPGGESAAG